MIYALVESEKTALFRSDDVGESWREVNSSFNVQADRPAQRADDAGGHRAREAQR